ncbi:MAG: hypothetical protein KJ065_04755 [Anaerolineae bacterium]|nr:hypothetical protein [Anaerolineae bacterium]
MAHIVNPYNLDTDDDAVFAGLLSQGLIWIEDDEEYDHDLDSILEEASAYIEERDEDWVNFSRVCQHLFEIFGKLDPKQIGQPNKRYKSLLKLFADYPADFELRQDNEKNGLYWIRLRRTDWTLL